MKLKKLIKKIKTSLNKPNPSDRQVREYCITAMDNIYSELAEKFISKLKEKNMNSMKEEIKK